MASINPEDSWSAFLCSYDGNQPGQGYERIASQQLLSPFLQVGAGKAEVERLALTVFTHLSLQAEQQELECLEQQQMEEQRCFLKQQWAEEDELWARRHAQQLELIGCGKQEADNRLEQLQAAYQAAIAPLQEDLQEQQQVVEQIQQELDATQIECNQQQAEIQEQHQQIQQLEDEVVTQQQVTARQKISFAGCLRELSHKQQDREEQLRSRAQVLRQETDAKLQEVRQEFTNQKQALSLQIGNNTEALETLKIKQKTMVAQVKGYQAKITQVETKRCQQASEAIEIARQQQNAAGELIHLTSRLKDMQNEKTRALAIHSEMLTRSLEISKLMNQRQWRDLQGRIADLKAIQVERQKEIKTLTATSQAEAARQAEIKRREDEAMRQEVARRVELQRVEAERQNAGRRRKRRKFLGIF